MCFEFPAGNDSRTPSRASVSESASAPALFCHAPTPEPNYADNTVGLSQLSLAHRKAIDTATATSSIDKYGIHHRFLLSHLLTLTSSCF